MLTCNFTQYNKDSQQQQQRNGSRKSAYPTRLVLMTSHMTCTFESETTAITPVLKYTNHEYSNQTTWSKTGIGPVLNRVRGDGECREEGEGGGGGGGGGQRTPNTPFTSSLQRTRRQENFTHE